MLSALTAAEMQYLPLVRQAAGAWGIDPALVAAIIQVESGWNPRAINPSDPSYGIMQVSLQTARELTGQPNLSPDDLLDPAFNIGLGVQYLARQLQRYHGQVQAAVAAYNAGSAITTEHGRFINQSYVDRVLAALPRYQSELAGEQIPEVSLTITATNGRSAQPLQSEFPWWTAALVVAGLVVFIVAIRR